MKLEPSKNAYMSFDDVFTFCSVIVEVAKKSMPALQLCEQDYCFELL